MIHIAVCDDDLQVIEEIEGFFERMTGRQFEYDVFFDGQELFDYKCTQQIYYNIYFLDIEMTHMDGITLARNLRALDTHALIIFITSYAKYVYDVFEVVTFDYLIKPLGYNLFCTVLHKALVYLDISKCNFTFSYRKNSFTLPCDGIVYIEKNGRTAFLHTVEKKYQFNMNLTDIWYQLDEKLFASIHRSVIVNLEYVLEIVQDELKLKTGPTLYVSRAYRRAVKLKHLDYVRGRL